MAVNFQPEDYRNILQKRLEYIGLGNFSSEVIELSTTPEYRFQIFATKNIPRNDLLMSNPFVTIINATLGPIEESIMHSGLILALKESHEKEIRTLTNKIKELEKQNMALSEAFTNGIEMFDNESNEESEK